MVPAMKIRKGALGDAAIIAEFNIRLARETEDLRLDPATVAQGVTALLQDPAKGIYFVAENESKIVGQLMITYEWSDWRNGNFWWIQSVYVTKTARRNGVFKGLFHHVHALARANKTVCGIRLYVDIHNEKAREAYASLGMTGTEYQVYE